MKSDKISPEDAQCAIRDAEFVLERDHMRSRIVNTANMIQSYWQEYQDYLVQAVPGHERIETHALADVAIKKYSTPLLPSDRPVKDDYQKELDVLDRRLRVLNRICMEMQELRAYIWRKKCE